MLVRQQLLQQAKCVQFKELSIKLSQPPPAGSLWHQAGRASVCGQIHCPQHDPCRHWQHHCRSGVLPAVDYFVSRVWWNGLHGGASGILMRMIPPQHLQPYGHHHCSCCAEQHWHSTAAQKSMVYRRQPSVPCRMLLCGLSQDHSPLTLKA